MTENDPQAQPTPDAPGQEGDQAQIAPQIGPASAESGRDLADAGTSQSARQEQAGLGHASGELPDEKPAEQFSAETAAEAPTQATYQQPHEYSRPANPYAPPGFAHDQPAQTRGFPAYQTASYAGAASSGRTASTETPAGKSRTALIAGVALISLVVGGVAGGIGGYLASDSGSTSVVSLDQPKPAKQTANSPAGSVEAVAEKLSPSVVQIRFNGRGESGEGSGFILSPDGYILTNNHVVELAADGGALQVVFHDGSKASAKIIGRDPTTDIAVVKAEKVSGLTPVELGRSDDLKVGQGVVAIGSPFDLAGTVTSGIVSSLHRPVNAGGEGGGQATVMDAVQTDAAINPGNSGGPLANMAGQVIGINSAIYSPQSASGFPGGQQSEASNVGIGFAIPIDQARRTADDIIKTGHATQTFIGATVSTAPEGGAAISQVLPGSPAEAAGLKQGDVVTKINDRPIDDSDTLIAAIRTQAPGEKVQLTLGDSRVVEVTLRGQPVEIK